MCGTLVRISRAQYSLHFPQTSLSSRRGAIVFQRQICPTREDCQHRKICFRTFSAEVLGNVICSTLAPLLLSRNEVQKTDCTLVQTQLPARQELTSCLVVYKVSCVDLLTIEINTSSVITIRSLSMSPPQWHSPSTDRSFVVWFGFFV